MDLFGKVSSVERNHKRIVIADPKILWYIMVSVASTEPIYVLPSYGVTNYNNSMHSYIIVCTLCLRQSCMQLASYLA